MKLEFFKRTPEEQAVIIREVAARRGISAVMVEKDFWVAVTDGTSSRTKRELKPVDQGFRFGGARVQI